MALWFPPPTPFLVGGCVLLALLLWPALPLPAVLLLGSCYAGLLLYEASLDLLPIALEKQHLLVEGTVVDLPELREDRHTVAFAIEQVQGADFKGLVRLQAARSRWNPLPGQRVRLAVQLKQPRGLNNPAGFDYRRWLRRHHFAATGQVLAEPAPELLEYAPWNHPFESMRHALRERANSALPDARARSLFLALLIGDRSGLSAADWTNFRLTGTSHLIAISGLHIGMLAWFAGGLLMKCWKRKPVLCLTVPAPVIGALGAWIVGGCYAGLAGFSVPTQRALLMLAVVCGAVMLRRPLWRGATLAVAFALVLTWDPMAAWDVGFWLSFAAVALLLWGFSGRLPQRDSREWLRAQGLVTLGLTPLLLGLFGQVPLLSPLINLVAIPWFTLLLVPLVMLMGVLLLIPGLGEVLLPWMAPLLRWTLDALQCCSWSDWGLWEIPQPPFWMLIVAAAGALLMMAPRGLPARWIGVCLWWPLLFYQPARPLPGELHVSLLDVGQGLSLVLRTTQHTLVYDAGPRWPSGLSTGEAVVAPFLLSQGIRRIQALVVSHDDMDHRGGVEGLLERVRVDTLYAGEPELLPGAAARQCVSGMVWHWDGVEFRFLHPQSGAIMATDNDRSCVLWAGVGEHGVLIMGDVDRRVEAALLRQHPGGGLAADVLIAGHHGSAASTSQAWLRRVQPRWVLFSAGHANRYGFPGIKTRQRVADQGAQTLNTAEHGAVGFILSAQGLVEMPHGLGAESAGFW